jgi:hypothetical protein
MVYAERRFSTDPSISAELRKPLLEVFNNQSTEEQNRIRKNFRTVSTFCVLDSACLDTDRRPDTAFAFPDEATGRALGVSEDELREGWVVEDDPSKIVAIALKTHINRDAIAGLKELGPVYTNRNRQHNLPHIKKEWNDFGPRKAETANSCALSLGIAMALSFVVYDLKKNKSPKLDEIFSLLNRRQLALEQQGPVFMDEHGRIYGYVVESAQDVRFLMKKDNLKLLAQNADYRAARANLAQHPEIEAGIEQFRERLEDLLTATTVCGLVKQFADRLDAKFAKLPVDDPQREVLAQMLDGLDGYQKQLGVTSGTAAAATEFNF